MSNQHAIIRSGGRLKPKTGSGDDQTRTSKPREKGLWNFLTWSFFLSQLVAAEQAAAANAAAEATSDDMGAGERGAAETDANMANSQPVPGSVSQAADAAPETAATTPAADAIVARALAAPPDGVEAAQHRPANEASDSPPEGGAGSSPSVAAHQTVAFEDGPAALDGALAGVPDIPSAGPVEIDLPLPPLVGGGVGDVVGGVVGGIVEPLVSTVGETVAPVLGAVDNVLHALEPVLGQVLAPVADITSDVVHLIEPVLESVVTPVVDIVGDVVQLVDPVVSQLVVPVAGIVGEAVQPLTSVLDQVTAPLTGILGDPLTSLLGPALGHGEPIIAAPAASGSASGGLSIGLHLDDLFSSGGYTEYGMALQSVMSTVVAPQPQSSTALSALDEHLAATSDESHEHGSGHAQHIGIPSALEELGLRGLGDGISL